LTYFRLTFAIQPLAFLLAFFQNGSSLTELVAPVIPFHQTGRAIEQVNVVRVTGQGLYRGLD
jgi:hypothetical protein